MLRVFISHQQADSVLAKSVAGHLSDVHGIACYLDVIDPHVAGTGPMIGEYVRAQLDACDQLLAVVSASTKQSWWVPWEIGIATEKNQPIATYAGDSTPLPEYLIKWPYLQSRIDLDSYAAASKQANSTLRQKRAQQLNESVARRDSTSEFYRVLRSRLGQTTF
ncbi:MAG: toll/interleukin-1 receptor domain-containing protein [Hyphomonadaceae bacterium]|nr:toll/interleukin-1 receptor domain-containing protein [Hyphomonadaceae bacterium]